MRLAIRFADKIVGLSIMLALGIVIFVLFMLGTTSAGLPVTTCFTPTSIRLWA